MGTMKVNQDNFEQEVLKATEPVLVDFYADWCGPCKMVGPMLEEIAQESKIKIVKVNVDENQELAGKYRVMTIPTLAVFRNGEVVETSIGVVQKERILEMIQ